MIELAGLGALIAGLDIAGILAGYGFGKGADAVMSFIGNKSKGDTWEKQLANALYTSLYRISRHHSWSYNPEIVSNTIAAMDESDAPNDWNAWFCRLLVQVFECDPAEINLREWKNCLSSVVVNEGFDLLYKKLTLDGILTPPEQSTQPTLPAIHLPPRNAHFTGREDTLQALAQGFEKGNAIALSQKISGMGGVGKSQTVLEYAHLHKDEYATAVWWVNADSPMNDLRDLLLHFGRIDENNYKEDDIRRALEQWYNMCDSWLLIFDNAEDETALRPWLPTCGHGHVLLTTRNQHAFDSYAASQDLDVFSPEDALEFLQNRLKDKPVGEGAEKLAHLLGYLPLALEQAASYIMTKPSMSYAKYIGRLKKYGLRMFAKDKPIDYRHVVTSTWQVSMKELTPAARDLLFLCAYLAPDNIDFDLYWAMPAEMLPPALAAIAEDELERDEAVAELTRYSLLKCSNETGLHDMHRLVQQVLRGETEDNAYLLADLEIILRALPRDYSKREHFEEFNTLEDHAAAVLTYALESLIEDEDKKRTALGIALLAQGYGKCGDYNSQLFWLRKQLEISEAVLGKDHPVTATTYNNIASVYHAQGKYDDALEWYNKALETYETVLGKNHPNTATTYNNIAGAYINQGKYDDALERYFKALEIREAVLGKDHPVTATIYNNIAGVYDDQGKYDDALEWHFKALEIRKTVLGKDHPGTATTYNNIAAAYMARGEYDDALEWYFKALEVWEAVLGKDHPNTATTYNNIAFVYYYQGELMEALELFLRAYCIRLARLGAEHPDTQNCLLSLQIVHKTVGIAQPFEEWLAEQVG